MEPGDQNPNPFSTPQAAGSEPKEPETPWPVAQVLAVFLSFVPFGFLAAWWILTLASDTDSEAALATQRVFCAVRQQVPPLIVLIGLVSWLSKGIRFLWKLRRPQESQAPASISHRLRRYGIGVPLLVIASAAMLTAIGLGESGAKFCGTLDGTEEGVFFHASRLVHSTWARGFLFTGCLSLWSVGRAVIGGRSIRKPATIASVAGAAIFAPTVVAFVLS